MCLGGVFLILYGCRGELFFFFLVYMCLGAFVSVVSQEVYENFLLFL